MTKFFSLSRSLPGRLFLFFMVMAAALPSAFGQFKFREPPNRSDPRALAPADGMNLWKQFLLNRGMGAFLLEGDLIYRPARAPSSSFSLQLQADWQPGAERTRIHIEGPPLPALERSLLVQSDGVFVIRDDHPESVPVLLPAEELTQPLWPGLPVSWNDLLLSFLKWPEVSYQGPTRVLGRPAHRFSLLNPSPDTGPASAVVILDEDFAALLQADLRAADGALLKRIRIGSFRQFGDQWMFSELFWEDRSSRDSVVLKVRDFSPQPAP